jgi:hypothetical protein
VRAFKVKNFREKHIIEKIQANSVTSECASRAKYVPSECIQSERSLC